MVFGGYVGFSQQEYEQLKCNLAGSLHAPERSKRQPNKWEAAFADELEYWKGVGVIRWFKFEGMRFRLANNAYYKPDFVAMQQNGDIIAYEVKGYRREAAIVRLKVAADQFPIYFILVTRAKNGGWQYDTFGEARDRLIEFK